MWSVTTEKRGRGLETTHVEVLFLPDPFSIGAGHVVGELVLKALSVPAGKVGVFKPRSRFCS